MHDLGGRNVRDGRDLDRGVTVAAIETELADVELMAVWDGLNGLVAHVRVPRGKVVPDARDHEDRTEAARDGGHDRELVPPRGEDLGQRLGLRGAVGQLPRPRVRDGTMMPHPPIRRKIRRTERKTCRLRRQCYPRTGTGSRAPRSACALQFPRYAVRVLNTSSRAAAVVIAGSLRGQELLQHARVPVLTEVLSGVEEDEENDDRPRPDRVAVVPRPEDRVQHDETRRDDQARHGQLEEQRLATDGPPGEGFFGLGHRMKSSRAGAVRAQHPPGM